MDCWNVFLLMKVDGHVVRVGCRHCIGVAFMCTNIACPDDFGERVKESAPVLDPFRFPEQFSDNTFLVLALGSNTVLGKCKFFRNFVKILELYQV